GSRARQLCRQAAPCHGRAGAAGRSRQSGKTGSRYGSNDGDRPDRRCRSNQSPRKAEGIVAMTSYFVAKGVNKPAIVLAILIAAAAAYSAWHGYETGARGYYWIAVGIAIIASLVPQSIMIADQWERAVVLRLGKLTAIRGPGMFAILPFIDTVASWLDQRIQTTEIRARSEQGHGAGEYRCGRVL